MELRFYLDPETRQPHIYRHDVDEVEVEDVLSRPLEDPRHLRARPRSRLGVRYHRLPAWAQGAPSAAQTPEEKAMNETRFPAGWDEARVRCVLEHYEEQSDEEAVAEDEAAYESTTYTTMAVPVDLVPSVRELIAKRRAG